MSSIEICATASDGIGTWGAGVPPAGGVATAPGEFTAAGATTRGPPGNNDSSPLPKAFLFSGAALSTSVTIFSAVVVMSPRRFLLPGSSCQHRCTPILNIDVHRYISPSYQSPPAAAPVLLRASSER